MRYQLNKRLSNLVIQPLIVKANPYICWNWIERFTCQLKFGAFLLCPSFDMFISAWSCVLEDKNKETTTTTITFKQKGFEWFGRNDSWVIVWKSVNFGWTLWPASLTFLIIPSFSPLNFAYIFLCFQFLKGQISQEYLKTILD